MNAPEQTAAWIDALWGTRAGWAALAYGSGPYRDANDKYKHRSWTPQWYRWPEQRQALLTDVTRELAAGAVDIYVAPHLRREQSRKSHTALPPQWLHADIDGDVGNPELWGRLDPIRVQSGTAGHEHGYVRLTRALELPAWDMLQHALRDRLGGDTDAKISDADVLRLPGTGNHKPTAPPAGVEPSEPTPVVLLPGGGRAWEPEELAAQLGIDLSAPNPAVNAHHGDPGPLTAVPVPEVLPHGVTEALERHRDNPDRSAVWQAVINACCGSAMSRDATFATVCAHVPGGVEKYEGRLDTEFTRSWYKAVEYWEEHPGGIFFEQAEAIRRNHADDPTLTAILDDLTAPAAIPAPRTENPARPQRATDEELGSFLASFASYRDPARLGRRIAWMRADGPRELHRHAQSLVTDAVHGDYPAARAVAALGEAYRNAGITDPAIPRKALADALGAVLNAKVSAQA